MFGSWWFSKRNNIKVVRANRGEPTRRRSSLGRDASAKNKNLSRHLWSNQLCQNLLLSKTSTHSHFTLLLLSAGHEETLLPPLALALRLLHTKTIFSEGQRLTAGSSDADTEPRRENTDVKSLWFQDHFQIVNSLGWAATRIGFHEFI